MSDRLYITHANIGPVLDGEVPSVKDAAFTLVTFQSFPLHMGDMERVIPISRREALQLIAYLAEKLSETQ